MKNPQAEDGAPQATRSCVIAYQGLEHRSAGGGQAAPAPGQLSE